MKRLLLCLGISTIFYSCKDSESLEGPDVNFYALTVGNSWVYKYYLYNEQTQLYDKTDIIDSINLKINVIIKFTVMYFPVSILRY